MRSSVLLALVLGLVACSDRPLPPRPIAEVISENAPSLMEIEHVQGVYEGKDDQGMPCVVVLVDELTPETAGRIPGGLEGYPVRVHVAGEIVPHRPAR